MARKNGAPTKAVMTPIGSSAGAWTVRATTSASARNAAPKQDRQRDHPAVGGAGDQAHAVGDDEPDEADESADRDRRRGGERCGDEHRAADAPGVQAERPGLLVAHGEDVERADGAARARRRRRRRTAASRRTSSQPLVESRPRIHAYTWRSVSLFRCWR